MGDLVVGQYVVVYDQARSQVDDLLESWTDVEKRVVTSQLARQAALKGTPLRGEAEICDVTDCSNYTQINDVT